MSRTFEIGDLVSLPQLDADSAFTVGQETLTWAAQEKKKLPPGIERAKKRLADSLGVLHTVQQQRLGAPAGEGRRTRAADAGEDGAFSILHGWLTALARLPAHFPEAAQAQAVLDVLFDDGLKFTLLPYKKEWAEAETRIARMAKDGLDKIIDGLGGAPILANLRQAHDEYGRALGITTPSAEADPVLLREPFEAVRAALRSYVLQVSSHADSEGDDAVALAERLLAPLREFAARKPARPGPEPPSPTPTPLADLSPTPAPKSDP